MKYEVTEKKAAERLGISQSRISQLVSAKLLDAVTINGKVRISEESLLRYMEESKRPGRPSRTSYATASAFTLMNGNHAVASVVFDTALDDPIAITEVFDSSRAPFGVLTSGGNPKKREVNDWWRHRSIPSSRPGLDAKLLGLGIRTPANLAAQHMGLSLSDCYWLRPQDAPQLAWSQVSYFANPFVESAPVGWDSWLSGVGLSSPDNTSEGELPKKWIIEPSGARCLLKGCRSDDQRPFNEVVATALFRRLLQPEDYVAYDLVSTAGGPASRCANFLDGHEEYVPAVYLKDLGGRVRAAGNYDRYCKTLALLGAEERSVRTALSKMIVCDVILANFDRHWRRVRAAGNYDRYCKTLALLGAEERSVRTALSKMIVCDVILANFDRHWRNFGMIRDVETLKLRPAPLFDSGNSLWYHKSPQEARAADWTFMARPFAQTPEEALACVDDLTWFNPDALDGFVDETCDILAGSRHANQPGRLDFIREGIGRNITLVRNAAKVLAPRINRGM